MEASGHRPIWSGQRVERTNAGGRHTYVPAFKCWIVEQAKQPGVSLAGLAMSNQVNANQLRRWVQLHGQQRPGPGAAATLLPVTVAMQQPPSAAVSRTAVMPVEVELCGAVVRVHDGVCAVTLRMVLACVRGTVP
jgi:transposase-like protein